MQDKYTYKIGKITYTQEELTWKQDKALLALYNRAQKNLTGGESISQKTIGEILTKYDLIGEYFGIILKPKINLFYIWQRLAIVFTWPWKRRSLRCVIVDAASNSLIENIFNDFFLLNKKLIDRLTMLGESLSPIAQAAKEMTESSKSNISAKKTKSKTKAKRSTGKASSSIAAQVTQGG